MRSNQPVLGQMFPHDVWLDVKLTGVPDDRRSAVMDRIRRLPGWSSSLTGSDGGSLRYRYTTGNDASIPDSARQLLRQFGATEPDVTSFVVWRLELDFRGPLHVSVFAPMTAAMREMGEVLDTHQRGELAGVVIEFRGQPPAPVVERVMALVQPHMAA